MAKKSVTILRDQMARAFAQIDKRIWHGTEEEILLGDRIYNDKDGFITEGQLMILETLLHWDRAIWEDGRKWAMGTLAEFEKTIPIWHLCHTPRTETRAKMKELRGQIFEYPRTRKYWYDAECKKYIAALCDLAIEG
jgi:hypothetical protein